MRRTIDSHHHGELPAAKELIHDSMRRSTAGPADFRTFWTHACAREVGFIDGFDARTKLGARLRLHPNLAKLSSQFRLTYGNQDSPVN